MLDELKGLLDRVGRTADAQRQREAMIDLLIWTMYADNLLALPENDRIDRLTEEMDWDSPTPAYQYVNAAIARVRDVLGDDEKSEQLLDDIYERLDSDEMRKQAYAACRELAKADGEVADEEMEFLNTVKHHFRLDGSN